MSYDPLVSVTVSSAWERVGDWLVRANPWLGPFSSIVNIATGAAVLYLTFVILRFTAKPTVAVHFMGEADGKPLHVGETVRLRFLLENRGYWYAQPAATNLFVFVNCAPGLEPIRMSFGTGLEAASDQVRPGKGETKYLLATGINLFYGEPGEEVELELRLPERVATYTARIAIHSDRGEDCGVHRFRLRITRPRLPGSDSQ